MTYDYDRLYAETPNALGPPTVEFTRFFDGFDKTGARVLDIGCGQGRDALFIARLGHFVVGVDLSNHGIRDLTAIAAREGLRVEGVVADIVDYRPQGLFDVIVIDRTLHMLAREARIAVLARLLDHVGPGGWILIADEPANMTDFDVVIGAHRALWEAAPMRRALRFLHRADTPVD